MAETALTQDIEAALLDAAKSVRSLCKRSSDLSATDVGFLCVDPILSALGWNTRDPRQVRRLDGETMQVEEAGKTLTVRALAVSQEVPGAAEAVPEGAEWLLVTNGMTWNLYSAAAPDAPFRTATLDTPTTTRTAAPTFALLQKGSLKADALPRAHAADSIDQDVRAALAKHLAGSDALISAIRSELGETDASDDAIRTAIAQIDLGLGDVVAKSDPAPQPAAEAEPKAEAPKPSGAKPGTAKKPTAAKRTSRKAAPKPAAKATTKASGKATKTTTKAASSASKPAAAETKPTESPAEKPAAAAPTAAEAPSDPGWPDNATHVMRRKKTVAYIKFDKKSDKATLLPGSILTAKVGKALNPQQVQAREQSMQDGSLKAQGDMVVVTTPMEFDNPRLAATFAAATLVKDISAWVAKNGRTMSPPKPAKTAPSAAAASAPQADGAAEESSTEEATVPAE